MSWVDLNGDGKMDLVGRFSSGAFAQLSNATGRNDLISSVKNSLGGTANVVYSSTALYPNTNNPPNFPVVASINVSDGEIDRSFNHFL